MNDLWEELAAANRAGVKVNDLLDALAKVMEA